MLSAPRTVQANVPLKTVIPLKGIKLLPSAADKVCLCEYNVERGIFVSPPRVVVPETDRVCILVVAFNVVWPLTVRELIDTPANVDWPVTLRVVKLPAPPPPPPPPLTFE
jgi:hypothetical protein